MSERSALLPAPDWDDRLHREPFTVGAVLRHGRYLGVPVLAVQDDGDGFLVSLWPDRLKPGRSHGKDKPFTFNKAEWWRVWGAQIVDAELEYEPPEFPLTLEPKPVPDEA